ncbi:MAG: hypothetical protein GY758_25625 [Fuerstiella sp.]|nr:hypothetical protein [Fuerstiella sp.]MCP4505443.1 hypothetical protein [Fuerstiella sp.]
MRTKSSIALLSILALQICPGCGDEGAVESTPPVMKADSSVDVGRETPVAAATAPGERKGFDGLKFSVPAGWEEMPLSQFQMGIISAKFAMPEAGPDVTLTLSRSGGSLSDNLDRWRGQVTQSRGEATETLTVAGVDATLIDLEGRFAAGFGREAQDGWRMLGIIAPLPDQGYFLKLTGPVDQVEAVEEDFRAFAKSAQRD